MIIHVGPANPNTNVDNCPTIFNAAQLNRDGNFIDLSPPKAYDDLTAPRSDGLGDPCDGDDDNDGLSDVSEASGIGCLWATAATNPMNADTDGDRVLDGAECALGTDPVDSSSKPLSSSCGAATDSDADGINDFVEVCFYNSNPVAADTDEDGCPDGREAASVNGDRNVNSSDLQQVASAYGPAGNPSYLVDLDFTKDGNINAIDLSQVAKRFGSCP